MVIICNHSCINYFLKMYKVNSSFLFVTVNCMKILDNKSDIRGPNQSVTVCCINENMNLIDFFKHKEEID